MHYNNLIAAELANKTTNYLCPNCNEIVILAGGRVQKNHFRHKVGGTYESCKLFVKGLKQNLTINAGTEVLFLEEMTNLVEREDYTIISYSVDDFNENKVPFLKFCNLNQSDFEKLGLEDMSDYGKYIRSKGLKYKHLYKECTYASIKRRLFKFKHFDVNINDATEAGFGVLKLHKGIYAGEKFLFSISPVDDDFNIKVRNYLEALPTEN